MRCGRGRTGAFAKRADDDASRRVERRTVALQYFQLQVKTSEISLLCKEYWASL
jgi:hypothetical protein